MAYNHGREDRKWRIWKEAEEKLLRECGVDEVTIEQIRIADRADFNSNRRFYRWTNDLAQGCGKRQAATSNLAQGSRPTSNEPEKESLAVPFAPRMRGGKLEVVKTRLSKPIFLAGLVVITIRGFLSPSLMVSTLYIPSVKAGLAGTATKPRSQKL